MEKSHNIKNVGTFESDTSYTININNDFVHK